MKDTVKLPSSCCGESFCESKSGTSSVLPDCLRCLKMKLRADSLAVYLMTPDGWMLEAFEGDIPEEAAEALFTGLLQAGLPAKLHACPDGIIADDNSALSSLLEATSSILHERSLVASPFSYDDIKGVRLALRDAQDPFSRTELELIGCASICPPGCCEV